MIESRTDTARAVPVAKAFNMVLWESMYLDLYDNVRMRREESIEKMNEYLCDIELYSRLVIVIRVKVLYIAVIDNLKRSVSLGFCK